MAREMFVRPRNSCARVDHEAILGYFGLFEVLKAKMALNGLFWAIFGLFWPI